MGSWYYFQRELWTRHRPRSALLLPPHITLALLARGFYPDRYFAYRLDVNRWGSYLSDRREVYCAGVDHPFCFVLRHKVIFASVFGRFVRVPKLYALVRGGRVRWLDGDGAAGDLLELLRRKGRLIVKPPDQGGGKGVRLLEHREGRFFRDCEALSEAETRATLMGSGDLVISEVVRQGAYASALYPHTVNTVRLLTMLDPDSGVPFLAAAVQRIGCSASIPVDNSARGGLVADIDLRSGRLSRAVRLKSEPCEWLDRHPETGIVFDQQVVPAWGQICATLLGTAARFPMLPLIAWDVALLDDGLVVIEGNHVSAVDMFQAFRPLLADSRVRAFLAHHRVL